VILNVIFSEVVDSPCSLKGSQLVEQCHSNEGLYHPNVKNTYLMNAIQPMFIHPSMTVWIRKDKVAMP
jgi:hypothetical protein